MSHKKFEIFSGTGGVGKTTLAASRAINLARKNQKVLLITIDPAKRLRDLLGLTPEQAGETVKVCDPFNEEENLPLDVQLMNPEKTFQRVSELANASEVNSNRILKILTKPYGGLNEILAIVELNLQYESAKYDVIVLDTPPGSHFLDFLDSIERIKIFFDKSFVEIFQYLGKTVESNDSGLGKKMMNFMMSKGIKKLLSYLDKVTGEKFVQDFIDAILAIYKTQSVFLEALNLQNVLKNKSISNWYLVTSVEQSKIKEAIELKDKAKGLIDRDSQIVINKCLSSELTQWNTQKETKEHILKESLLQRENEIKEKLKNNFNNVLEFPEIISVSPIDHLKQLCKLW